MRKISAYVWGLIGLCCAFLNPSNLLAQDTDLAQKLSNPVAALISVPFQLNYDQGFGATGSGSRTVLNIQPVIPISLSNEWNVISRTIFPIVSASDFAPGFGTETGIGDTLQSLFFSPKEPTSNGVVWGAGPVIGLPTATDSSLGTGKWLLGPTAVVLRIQGPVTYGALANHVWSVGGSNTRSGVNQTFLQPFVSYTTPEAWTYSFNIESAYDWQSEQWSIPVNLAVAKLVKINRQPVSLQLGLRYWADSPAGGAEDFGARLGVTYLFPK